MKLSVLFSLVLVLTSPYTYAEPDCGDYLAAFNKKPDNLEFIGCEDFARGGQQHSEAKYRVSGTHAAAVEDYLVKVFNMRKLRFYCCGWEPEGGRTGGYSRMINKVDYIYAISMYSADTYAPGLEKKKNWQKIHFFHVRVTLYNPGTL